MKNYQINGLIGRVQLNHEGLLEALNKGLDFVFFVSNNGCIRCLDLEKEICEHPGALIFEISYREYQIACLEFNDLPFVYSFPTGIIVEKGKVIDSDLMGEKTSIEFYEWLISRNEKESTVIDNPFKPVLAKDGTLRRYKADKESIDTLISE